MKHHVQTSYGDSTKWFGGPEWMTPIHGMGQGNGAGPAIWAAVSTPVLNLMQQEGHGTFFHAALTNEEIRFVRYAFVDDTDLCETTQEPDTTAAAVAHRMQAVLECWEGGIRATGGAIMPAKSHWYLIDFAWKMVPGNMRPSNTHRQNCMCEMPMAISAQSNASQLLRLVKLLAYDWPPMATTKKSTTIYALRHRAGRSRFIQGTYHATLLGRHCSPAYYPN